MPDFLAGELSKPQNSAVRMAVDAAIEAGLPPSLVLEPSKETPTWTSKDKKLLLARHILKSEIDSETGLPVHIAYSESSDLIFEVEKKVNYAKAALEKHQDKESQRQSKSKNSSKSYGEVPIIVPKVWNGKDYVSDPALFPTREDYYNQIAEE